MQREPIGRAGELHEECISFMIHSWLIDEVPCEVWQSKLAVIDLGAPGYDF